MAARFLFPLPDRLVALFTVAVMPWTVDHNNYGGAMITCYKRFPYPPTTCFPSLFSSFLRCPPPCALTGAAAAWSAAPVLHSGLPTSVCEVLTLSPSRREPWHTFVATSSRRPFLRAAIARLRAAQWDRALSRGGFSRPLPVVRTLRRGRHPALAAAKRPERRTATRRKGHAYHSGRKLLISFAQNAKPSAAPCTGRYLKAARR